MTYQPSAEVVAISPEMARQMLSRNTQNRPVSQLHVHRLMREMESGRWAYNGEAIKWDANGLLLDGQHRLTALSRMPDDFAPVPILVVQNLAPHTQNTMDQGKVRSAADQMSINGLAGSNAKTVTAALRMYVAWTTGTLFGDRKAMQMSTTAVVEWAEEHPDELDILDDITTSANLRKIKASPSVTAAVMLRLRQIDDEAQREFFHQMYTGTGLTDGHPVLVLRDRLDKIRDTKTQASDRDFIAFFIMAWNAWREGRTMTKLQRPRTGAWTRDNFPEPK